MYLTKLVLEIPIIIKIYSNTKKNLINMKYFQITQLIIQIISFYNFFIALFECQIAQKIILIPVFTEKIDITIHWRQQMRYTVHYRNVSGVLRSKSSQSDPLKYEMSFDTSLNEHYK